MENRKQNEFGFSSDWTVREEEEAIHTLTEENSDEIFMNHLFMEMITLALRSTSASVAGVSLYINIEIPASYSVREVMARFIRKLSVPVDRLVIRCNGRELGVQEQAGDSGDW